MTPPQNSAWPIRHPKILRVLAWLSVALLLCGWLAVAFHFFSLYIGALIGAFVLGVSSCERLGGLCAGLAVLSIVALLIDGSGGAIC